MAPTELASFISYPDAGYNHSGWLSDDGTIYAMQDENHGYDVKIMDVSDFNNITLIHFLKKAPGHLSLHFQTVQIPPSKC